MNVAASDLQSAVFVQYILSLGTISPRYLFPKMYHILPTDVQVLDLKVIKKNCHFLLSLDANVCRVVAPQNTPERCTILSPKRVISCLRHPVP